MTSRHGMMCLSKTEAAHETRPRQWTGLRICRAGTWSHQIPALAAAGYRAVAPYLRGYSPTEIPRDGFYDKATLATDVAELIRALGGGPAHLIGQDWGATIGYAVLAAFPELGRVNTT